MCSARIHRSRLAGTRDTGNRVSESRATAGGVLATGTSGSSSRPTVLPQYPRSWLQYLFLATTCKKLQVVKIVKNFFRTHCSTLGWAPAAMAPAAAGGAGGGRSSGPEKSTRGGGYPCQNTFERPRLNDLTAYFTHSSLGNPANALIPLGHEVPNLGTSFQPIALRNGMNSTGTGAEPPTKSRACDSLVSCSSTC